MGNSFKKKKNLNNIDIKYDNFLILDNKKQIPSLDYQIRFPSLDNLLNIHNDKINNDLNKINNDLNKINNYKDKINNDLDKINNDKDKINNDKDKINNNKNKINNDKDKINSLNYIKSESSLSDEIFIEYDFNKIKSYPNNILNSNFQESKFPIVIIIIDFINSTEIIKESIDKLIYITTQFNKDILNILNNNIFSYISIYEIVGDSYILTINFPNTKIILNPALLAIKFCKNIINVSNKYIDIRIGISYEKLYYGIINNHIRIFGKGICLASRLENKSSKNNIFHDKNFNKQLLEENKLIKNNEYNFIFENYNHNIKGIGDCNYYSLNLEDNKLILLKIMKYYNIILNLSNVCD